jgi:hypothetical protein
MAKAKKDTKKTESREQPLTLEALQQFGVFKDFNPPAGSFDPRGPWRHAYSIWVVGMDNSGYLQLERTAAALKVRMTVAQSAGSMQRTEAAIECADDALFTPRAWRMDCWLDGLDGKPIPQTKVSGQAVLKDGNLELEIGGRTVTRKVPARITSNWSLFDVVQRLPGAQTQPLSFALLEDLDLVKADQQLIFRESREIKLNGKALKLDRYDHLGQGVLPWQYWVDDRHRLLVAYSGQKAFVFDAEAVKRFAELPKGRKSKIKVVD